MGTDSVGCGGGVLGFLTEPGWWMGDLRRLSPLHVTRPLAMDTTVKQLSDVEYELEITATAADLAPDVKAGLKTQRGRAQLKGFRAGKVPMSLIRKMYGEAVTFEVAEQTIQRVYGEEILESDTYDVMGQPRLHQLNVALDSDLKAVVRFSVRPVFELASLEGETLPRLVQDTTDDEVEEQLERIRRKQAELAPLEEPLEDTDYVLIDLQKLDPGTGTPLIGDKEEGTSFFLDDEKLKDELKEALLGKQAGDVFRVQLPDGEGDLMAHYEVTVRETKRLDLPELDDEFVQELTNEKLSTVDELRDDVRGEIEKSWSRIGNETFESLLIERVLKRNPIPVPEAAIQIYLDSFVEDVKRRNEGNLPDGFDETSFRHSNRTEAEQQARWMLIRDKIVETEGLEVDDDALDAHFASQVGDDEQVTSEQLRQFYRSMPQLQEQLEHRLLSERVLGWLETQVAIEELDKDAFRERVEALRAPEEPAPEADAPETSAEAESTES